MKENNNNNDNDNNEFLLEGLPQDEHIKVEESGSESNSDNNNSNKRSKKNLRSTVKFPQSRYSIEDKIDSKILELEQTDYENKLDEEDEDEYEYDNEETNAINNSSRILGLNEILNLEDPFTRVSRSRNMFFNKRASAFNGGKKKKRSGFYFEKKILNERKKLIDDEDNKINNLNIDEEKSDKDEEKKNKEDESDNFEFVKGDRPSFLNRNSIDLEQDKYEVEVIDSVWLTVLQVINCMIKANLIQIANSMKILGIIWGPIVTCIIALMSLITLSMILEVNQMTGQRSYLIFSEMIFGHFGSVVILICQFMSAFGGCLSYIVIFNKVVPNLLNFSLPNENISNETIFSFLLGFALYFYCYKQDVNVIKTAAKYAVFGILLFFVVTIIDFILAVFSQNRLVNLKNWNHEAISEILYGLNRPGQDNRLSNLVSAIACIILSYSFHVFTFSIYGCMGKISKKQFFITTSISVLITTIIYLICGIIGYLLYYDELKDSILDCMHDNWSSSLLSIANVINVIMTFPITFAAVKSYFLLFIGIMATLLRDLFLWIFKCIPKVEQERGRTSNERITKVFRKSNNNKSLLMSGNPLVKFPKFMEIILTTFMFVLVFYVATIYNELKKIFSLTGGVMGNILSFIFPSLFYLGFSKKKFSKYGIIAFFFIIFGFITMFICIASTTGLIEKLGIEDII